jgi:SagB-type dehydrogenase family enzyme
VKLRRAKPIACYWEGDRLVARNYLSGRQAIVPPLAAQILAYCHVWRSAREVRDAFGIYPSAAIGELLSLLTDYTLLERRAAPRRSDPIESWTSWMPEGAFFHFATKHVRYRGDEAVRRELEAKARRELPPPAVKRQSGVPRTLLPAADDAFALAQVLQRRRTWRRFRRGGAVPVADVATLLGLTWGVQQWTSTALGRLALKTSPSGGARHPIEVYLLATRVAGLRQGWYHYDPDAHALARVGRPSAAATPAAYLPRQQAFGAAPALFVMSAVFARTQWAYPHPRAYRVVLLDAGHLAQTFCLVATALGLAPFCSAALADARLERDLSLDGITESVIYACGAGLRPDGVDWAPFADPARTPRVIRPTWARRKQPSM